MRLIDNVGDAIFLNNRGGAAICALMSNTA
jgi:hypothetical protein